MYHQDVSVAKGQKQKQFVVGYSRWIDTFHKLSPNQINLSNQFYHRTQTLCGGYIIASNSIMKFRTLAITYVLEKVPLKNLPSRENCPLEISSTRIVVYPLPWYKLIFMGQRYHVDPQR